MAWATLRRRWHNPFGEGYIPILGLGLLIRLFLMPITWHNDVLWAPWMAHLITDGAHNVYQELFNRFGPATLAPTVWAPYLPYYYYLMAGWTGLLDILGLTDPSGWSFSAMGWSVPNVPRAVFLMKVPWLVADFAIWALILSLLARSERRAFSWLYLFSPSQLWVSFVMGQNDILPALAAVAALWCAVHALRSNRFVWSVGAVLCLGIGGGVKLYPLLLILPMALVLGKSVFDTLALTAAGLVPFAAAVLPYIRTPAFVQGALFNQEGMGLTRLVLGTKPQAAPVFLIVYGLLLAYLAFADLPRTPRTLRLVCTTVVVLLLVMGAWPFNWLAWLMPLLAWAIVEDNVPDILYAMTGLYFAGFLTAWGKPVGGYTFYPLGQTWRYFRSFRDLVRPYLSLDDAQGWLFASFVVSVVSVLVLAVWDRQIRRKREWSFGAWSAIGPTAVLAAMVVLSALLGGHGFPVREQRDISGIPISVNTDVLVQQSFRMDVDGFHALDIWLVGPLPDTSEGTLQVKLTGSETMPPLTGSMPASRLRADAMNRIELSRALPASTYTFAVRWTGSGDLLLGQSSRDVLAEGELYVHGEQREQDLAFQTIADADPRSIIETAIERLSSDWSFGLGWILTLVILGIGVITTFLRHQKATKVEADPENAS